ncbi:unnamed protein product [Mytilus coruscus]|uniref:LRP2 n=1 Tax=Mytilus coruscus TaxID=42192 RepID=A0A6J8E2X2_MYTCO|nr:unnamed protein product [Mytilus coruscus]
MEKFDNKTVVVKLFYISSIVCYLAISCDISHNEFECSDGTCIPEYWYCDAYVDCEDGSDEANCLLECLTDEIFMCNDGFCIYNEWTCDNETDCSENEDEENCQGGTETTQTSENELTTESMHRFSTTIGYNFTILSNSTTPTLRKSGEMTEQTKSVRTTNDHLISEDFQTTTTSLPLTTTDHTTTIDIVQPTTDHTTTSIGVVQQITEHTTTIIDIVQPTTDHITTIIDIVQQTTGHTTTNIDVVQQITTIAGVSSFQGNKEAHHGY